jgi:hypothetical protein
LVFAVFGAFFAKPSCEVVPECAVRVLCESVSSVSLCPALCAMWAVVCVCPLLGPDGTEKIVHDSDSDCDVSSADGGGKEGGYVGRVCGRGRVGICHPEKCGAERRTICERCGSRSEGSSVHVSCQLGASVSRTVVGYGACMFEAVSCGRRGPT